MVSLLKLCEITEEGVNFESPYDGSKCMLTPERSIGIQQAIGADIMMQLDDVVSSLVTGPRVEEAMWRSIRWLDRCIKAHARPKEQNLYAIIQGGLDLDLRKTCVEEMVKRGLPGYAIGGLSGGEEKDKFWRVVKRCCELLPDDKPRYLMGVGYALDLVVCSALGVDQFDCVFPTRTARFGVALVRSGQIQLKAKENATLFEPIAKDCPCTTCRDYTRAFLHTIVNRESVCCHLVSVHNIAFQLELMTAIRKAIISDTFPNFVKEYLSTLHPKGDCPQWAIHALSSVGIEVPSVHSE